MNWINTVNTTNLRIVVSLILAVIYVLVILLGVISGHLTDGNSALDTAGLFIFGMMGVDAVQFTAKRFSDSGLAAAKRQPVVSVAAPATVQVLPDSGDKA